jgi:hypothetical protein
LILRAPSGARRPLFERTDPEISHVDPESSSAYPEIAKQDVEFGALDLELGVRAWKTRDSICFSRGSVLLHARLAVKTRMCVSRRVKPVVTLRRSLLLTTGLVSQAAWSLLHLGRPLLTTT